MCGFVDQPPPRACAAVTDVPEEPVPCPDDGQLCTVRRAVPPATWVAPNRHAGTNVGLGEYGFSSNNRSGVGAQRGPGRAGHHGGPKGCSCCDYAVRCGNM